MSHLDVLILAAGRGTRMRSEIPKVLHPLLGEPLLAHVLDAALTLEPREVGVVVGHGADQVRAAVGELGVTFFRQREQRGTGHAVRTAARRWRGRRGHVMVLSGDVPLIRSETLAGMFAAHRKSRAAATVMTATLEEPGSLGRIKRDDRGRLESIVEARDADFSELAIREVNAGIYLFRNRDLFERLSKLRPNPRSGEYYLTDVVRDLVASRRKVGAWPVADPSEARGINTGGELLQAQDLLRRRIALEHTARGVELVDPTSTFIAKGVTIGPGTVVWPFSVIQAGVSIGARCRIGPFAHLRPGTVVGDECVVGNFVEVKNSNLGRGSLAAHLSYLGDARLGEGVNVGAGTITANFDGVAKHETEIGDGARLGAGTILIAPANVGRDARTGAGAVVLADDRVADGDTVVGVPARSVGRKKVDGRRGKSRRRPRG